MGSSEGFVKLREEILSQVIPLLDSDAIPTEDRFRIILQIAQTKGALNLYEKAFHLAQELDKDDKLGAYMDVLASIDERIQEEAESTDDGSESWNRDASPQVSEGARPITVN